MMLWKPLQNILKTGNYCNLKLIPININEDKTEKIFASENCRQVLDIYKTYYPKIGFNFPWIGYFILNEDNIIVGSCSFTGKPVNNEVEIAYYTFKENEGKGIGAFACKELIEIARTADASVIITAKTAPEHNQSTKILERNNFKLDSVVKDDDIGDAWLWKL